MALRNLVKRNFAAKCKYSNFKKLKTKIIFY